MPKFPQDPVQLKKLVERVTAKSKRVLFRGANGEVCALVPQKDLEILEDADDERYLEKLRDNPELEDSVAWEDYKKELSLDHL